MSKDRGNKWKEEKKMSTNYPQVRRILAEHGHHECFFGDITIKDLKGAAGKCLRQPSELSRWEEVILQKFIEGTLPPEKREHIPNIRHCRQAGAVLL